MRTPRRRLSEDAHVDLLVATEDQHEMTWQGAMLAGALTGELQHLDHRVLLQVAERWDPVDLRRREVALVRVAVNCAAKQELDQRVLVDHWSTSLLVDHRRAVLVVHRRGVLVVRHKTLDGCPRHASALAAQVPVQRRIDLRLHILDEGERRAMLGRGKGRVLGSGLAHAKLRSGKRNGLGGHCVGCRTSTKSKL